MTTDKPLTMICATANKVAETGKPVSYRNLKQDAAYRGLTDDQKRQLALKAVHATCKSLCGCWCHKGGQV